MKKLALGVTFLSIATFSVSSFAHPRQEQEINRLQNQVRQLESTQDDLIREVRQLNRSVDRLENNAGRGGISCSWNGEKYLSKGWDGGQAFNIGAFVNCQNGKVTNMRYIGE